MAEKEPGDRYGKFNKILTLEMQKGNAPVSISEELHDMLLSFAPSHWIRYTVDLKKYMAEVAASCIIDIISVALYQEAIGLLSTWVAFRKPLAQLMSWCRLRPGRTE